jgi:hypothetical protein
VAAGDVALVTPGNLDYLPVGTTMFVRLGQSISTANQPGDTFSGTVVDSVYSFDNTVAVPAGATLFGRVTGVHRATGPGDQNLIRLSFDEVHLNGRAYPYVGAISGVALQTDGGPNAGLGTSRSSVRAMTTGRVASGSAASMAANAPVAVVSGDDLSRIITAGRLSAASGTVISIGASSASQATIPAGATVTVRSTQPFRVR